MNVDINDYSSVVQAIADYYNVSSQQAWNIINTYDLTPSQFAEILPDIGANADGIVSIYNRIGEAVGYANTASIPFSDGNVAQSAINSNIQSGTSSTTYKTVFPGNSVIDSNGKVKTSSGLTKYSNGSPVGTAVSVLGSALSAVGAVATGISLGKKIDAALYGANPAFWDSIGMSTLNPETWNSITSGEDGIGASILNMVLGLNPDGSVQTYMSEDAYKYMAYVLAQAGVFNQGEVTYEKPPVSTVPSQYRDQINNINNPIITSPTFRYYNTRWRELYEFGTSSAPVDIFLCRSPNHFCVILGSTSPFSATYKWDTDVPNIYYNPSSWRIPSFSVNNYTVNGVTYYFASLGPYNSNEIQCIPEAQNYSKLNNLGSNQFLWEYIIHNGTKIVEPAVEGITDQPGATVPTGIDDNSTQQQVADYIDRNYPDLENERLEQTVVQPDGTTKTIKYYPVPLPNDTTTTTLSSDTTLTLDGPITVILPNGSTITLPDGTKVTGDGKTPITIPAGTITLPNGTIILNRPVSDTTTPDGSTQTDTSVTEDSTTQLIQLILRMLLSRQPQELTDTQTDTETTDTSTNPTDTGDGQTPPTILPTGQASALWSVYNPTLAEINAFGSWLWSTNFVDQLLKMFNDPMQAIIGLHKTYIAPITGSAQDIKVGYLNSGVSCLTVPTQYSEMSCGTVSLPEYFGNVFDYSPYTRVFIYLPFIGFKELDVSQVMRSKISVKYKGDAYTGAGLCEVSVVRDADAGGVLYTFACDVAARYPLSHGSYMGMVGGIATLAAGAAGALMGMPMMPLGVAASVPFTSRNKVELSGNFSGNAGAMGGKKPYLVIMRPQTAMPSNYKHFSGIPSSTAVTISQTSGLIRVRECHVENIPKATREEKNMIESLLKSGIIV